MGRPLSELDCSFVDPIKMAKLWRIQNAKVIHLVDGQETGTVDDDLIDLVGKMADCLDIPLQFEGNVDSRTVDALLSKSKISRIVARIGEDIPEFLSESVSTYGASRICALLSYPTELENGDAHFDSLHSRVSGVIAAGCRRLVMLDSKANHQLEGHNRKLLSQIARAFPKARISAMGGIGSYEELKLLELQAPRNVDSVIIGRALYENRFPCQQFWCWHKKDSVNLSQYSSASLKNE